MPVLFPIPKGPRRASLLSAPPPREHIVRRRRWNAINRRLRLIFARIAPADAPGVLFDFSQGGVERGMRPLLYPGHGFQGVALGANRELMGGALCDAPH